jgi:hypothetical protein
MYQASILDGEKNQVDACLAGMLDILNVQDILSVTKIIEDLS